MLTCEYFIAFNALEQVCYVIFFMCPSTIDTFFTACICAQSHTQLIQKKKMCDAGRTLSSETTINSTIISEIFKLTKELKKK